MRISYQRTGGFTGIALSFEVQTETLPPDEAIHIEKLVDGSSFFDLPSKIISVDEVRDQFQYRVTITTEEHQHTVDVGDAAAPDSLLPLLEELKILYHSAKKYP